MKYGYVRANNEKFINVQINFLQNKVDKIFIENNGNELKKLLEDLQQNDTIFIYDLNRLSRKRTEAIKIIKIFLNKNVTVYTPEGKISSKDLAYAVGIITDIKKTDSPYEAFLMEMELSKQDSLVDRMKDKIKARKERG